MHRTSTLPLLTLALLLACGGNPALPSLSTDYRPGGLPTDVAGEMSEDVPEPRDGIVPTEDGVVVPDPGPDAVVPDDVAPECESGGIRGTACGLNGNGLKPQSCVDGLWIDGGPCQDPDACTNGDVQKHPCGLNDRGLWVSTCVGGQWAPGVCQDPDVCKDGDAGVLGCGKNDAGTQAQWCKAGAWAPDGPCVQPGRWRCIDNVCTAQFGDAACGDGICSPRNGESPTSCPADCDMGTVDGQGQDCKDAVDCVFYKWTAKGPGYWECRGFMRRTCNAVVTDAYCGTSGYDYCYFDATGMETIQSCPQDCTPQYSNCGSDLECIYQEWPAP